MWYEQELWTIHLLIVEVYPLLIFGAAKVCLCSSAEMKSSLFTGDVTRTPQTQSPLTEISPVRSKSRPRVGIAPAVQSSSLDTVGSHTKGLYSAVWSVRTSSGVNVTDLLTIQSPRGKSACNFNATRSQNTSVSLMFSSTSTMQMKPNSSKAGDSPAIGLSRTRHGAQQV